MDKNKPLVAIIGRTNVGKSTLFNRLIEEDQALVSMIEGTTRDTNIGEASWNGVDFTLSDTAGVIDIKYLSQTKPSAGHDTGVDLINFKSQQQILKFLEKAKVILFLVDAKAGLVLHDRSLARFLSQHPKIINKTLLVANKVDSNKVRSEASEFNRLGLGEPWMISAATGSGTGDLLDEIVGRLPKPKEEVKAIEEDEEDENVVVEPGIEKVKVCIIGKPNVGKSSMLNALAGYERVIVSDTPHTTREPQDIELEYDNHIIEIVDTAGISKHGHKVEKLEKYGIIKSLDALKKADVVLLILDINEPLTHQDAKILEEVKDYFKSFIIIGNKWDLVEEKDRKKWTETVYRRLPFALWAPVIFVSALKGIKVKDILDPVVKAYEARKTRLSGSQLEKFLARIIKIHKPAKGKGLRHPHIYEFKQDRINPPKFSLRIGSKDDLHFSYVRFMENRLREQYDFFATPISLTVVKNRRVHGRAF